jgi:3-oxoacyl-[acyl-carrier-protein] synthase II
VVDARPAAVAITGMAWSTALGDDLDRVWGRLLAGEDGFAPHPSPFPLRNDCIAACDGTGSAGARLRTLAAETATRAIAAAGLDGTRPDLVIGTSLGAYLDDEDDQERDLYAWAHDVADRIGARPPVCVSTACSSSADALLIGAELVRTGAADVCLAGGADVVTPVKRLAHSALATMSRTRPRAFDRRRDGMLLGEGAAFLVLERVDEAIARRAPWTATLRGVGSANDAAGMTAPHPTGAAARLAMRRALTDAGVDASAVGVVHAHGSATALNDAIERDAFTSLFGSGPLPIVFATKCAFGHTLGATGAMETIALVLALRHGAVPPIAGLAEPDPEMPFALPCGALLRHAASLGLSLTLGFGGFNTAVIVEVAA